MPDVPASSSGSDTPEVSPSLQERVLAKVYDAGLAVDRRANASRPRSRRRRASQSSASRLARTPEQAREALCLRRVFDDLGDSYRHYRRETGAPLSAEIRDAARRFKREISLPALLLVAARLDRLAILSW